MGNALVAEYEDVAGRADILEQCPISPTQIRDLLEAFCTVCEWVPIYFLLRPNLPDEGDNHLLELAVAGNARWVVTNNLRDFAGAELHMPGIGIVPPKQILTET